MRVRATSDPAWPIVFDPDLSSLCASKSIKLLLWAFRPGHNDEIAIGLRWKDFERGSVFNDYHFQLLPLPDGHSLPQREG
jgi:hypothetical protein